MSDENKDAGSHLDLKNADTVWKAGRLLAQSGVPLDCFKQIVNDCCVRQSLAEYMRNGCPPQSDIVCEVLNHGAERLGSWKMWQMETLLAGELRTQVLPRHDRKIQWSFANGIELRVDVDRSFRDLILPHLGDEVLSVPKQPLWSLSDRTIDLVESDSMQELVMAHWAFPDLGELCSYLAVMVGFHRYHHGPHPPDVDHIGPLITGNSAENNIFFALLPNGTVAVIRLEFWGWGRHDRTWSLYARSFGHERHRSRSRIFVRSQ